MSTNGQLFRSADLGGGLRLHLRRTKTFKTVTACLTLHANLDARAAARALVPRVLARGTRRLPSLLDVQRELDRLFGANLHGEAHRIGERQVLQFRGDWVTDRLAGRRLLREMARFLGEYIHEPALSPDGGLRDATIEQERKVMADEAASVYDDKGRYVHHKLLEHMCRGEPYARPAIGHLEEIRALRPRDVRAAYRSLLQHAPADLFLVGDLGWRDALGFARSLRLDARAKIARLRGPVRRRPSGVRTRRESQAVEQAKLGMGFRTSIRPGGPLAPALSLMNALFGGSSVGTLFSRVREEASLCYSIASWLERTKGLLFVHAGIEESRYAQARRLILRQLDDLRAGRIDPGMLARAREMMLSGLRSMPDSPNGLIDFSLERAVNGLPADLEGHQNAILGVTAADVARAARTVLLDTVYLLRS